MPINWKLGAGSTRTLSADEARYILKKDDDERRKWGLKLFGADTWDPKLYDLVIHIRLLTVDDAVNLILCAAKLPDLQTTPESQKRLDDLALGAQVEAALVEEFPTVQVTAQGGEVFVSTKGSLAEKEEVTGRIRRIASKVAGVEVQVQFQLRP